MMIPPTGWACAAGSRWTSVSGSWRQPSTGRCSQPGGSEMHSFNPLTISLAGRQLIEASAGTGKTFSLALLFLRLILEQGLEAEQILVVTFTNAATEELRGRIRARLREALDILEGAAAKKEGDLLAGLLVSLKDPDESRRRLLDTLTRMDEAAIYTIHGFCQRMLQEQAFEAGTAFTVEFIESEQLLRREIVEDFWRQRFYPASAEEAEWATACWQDPDGLLQDLKGFLARPEVTYVPVITVRELHDLQEQAESRWLEVRAAWLQGREEVTAILHDDPCLSRNKSNGYGGESLVRIIEGMEQLAARENMAWLLPKGVELLAASVMACNLKGKKIRPAHPFFTLFDAWQQLQHQFTRAARAHTLAAVHRFLQFELTRRKQEQNVLYFDDQLSRLAGALAGGEGRLLARRIRSRFRVALVDEFQDTDPLQYRIFQSLFGREPDPGLFMIGDPKQSIYSFRGAAIFAYIRARRETPAGAAHTMDTNYRSTPAMVRAVNRLFGRRPHFVFAEIEFNPVKAGLGVEERQLLVEGAVVAPLQVQMLPLALAAANKPTIAKDRAAEAAAAWTAREIARLLLLGRSGGAKIGKQPLTGGDLAVLVRTHREAELVRRALSQLDIASVYYSQDSVFATDEARQLHQLLAALLDLSDGARIANALVTDLFGLDSFALHALRGDQLRWGEVTAELADYHQRWNKAGVMAMLHLVLHRRQAVTRLLAVSGGERKLTNFLHLAELLQVAAGRYRMDELVRWFSQQLHAPDLEAASQQLRLESDGDLVKIVTIHKAKGLEYPLVFLPFLWSARQVQKEGIFAYHGPGPDGQDTRLYVDVGSGREENYHQAERERLAEDLRLLYVAVTRARCCCYFCWGPVSSLEESAMAWLLHPDDSGGDGVVPCLTEEKIRADLAGLNNGQGLVAFVPWPATEAERVGREGQRQNLPGPARFTGRIDTSWAVTSYSRLLAVSGEASSLTEAGDSAAEPDKEMTMSVFSFPRGAEAGTFLHAVLEQLDFQYPAAPGAAASVTELLQRSGLAPHWAPLVLQWLAQVADTPLLAGSDLRLRLVPSSDRLAELGFHFALDNLEQAALNAMLREHSIPPVEMPQARVHGLMKGYIDLVFRHQGRFYLADYKSNYLGAAVSDYRQENLTRAMAGHRYDLQYLIYCVALHRYLGRRLPAYDYDRDFGGVFYLFLRGMRPELGPACGVWHARPPRALIEGLDRCCGYREVE
ncbi:MAG: exodeoxyribonuclease V subunit beta [Desulfobulbaceae bacterium]